MRKLSAEEEALWSQVTATIKPLSRGPLPARHGHEALPMQAVAAPAAGSSQPKPKGRVPPVRAAPPKPIRASRVHGSLDGHWDRRLRTGNVAVDRTLDLHGHSLDSAWEAIDRMLEQAIAAGDRVILLVTGHARPGEPPVQRGKIRAAVHDWLSVSRHAGAIAAVRSAHRRHGGGGSLYLILRR